MTNFSRSQALTFDCKEGAIDYSGIARAPPPSLERMRESPLPPRLPAWTMASDDEREDMRTGARRRAQSLNARLNTFVSIAAGSPHASGVLAGLPYAAKDMFRSRAHEPTCGFAAAGDMGIVGTCDLLGCLDEAGADFVGFTNMPALAYEPSGWNAARGRVRNPWNPQFISGGSSSGSAVAVASGAVVAALGSDTGGSLRIPAHACGVSAWKPTWGLVSTSGAMALAPTLDTVGLIARSAADLVILAGHMAQLPSTGGIHRAAVLNDVVVECEPSVRRAIEDGLAALASCHVTLSGADGTAAIDTIDRHALVVMQGEAAHLHQARLDQLACDQSLRRRVAKGLEIDAWMLDASRQARATLAADSIAHVLRGADAAVLPVMTIRTPEAEECDPTSERFSAKTLYALSRWTRFVNMLGFPAIALPVGFDDRAMPVALQVVGRPGSDLALLDLGQRMQATTDWHARLPTGILDLAELAGSR
jgi:Asp-tRNA(Asn)/Glu-tRNA(Gln) amidotransferase A subunit family amidase